ncbi:hypothetical protein E6W93_22515 [Salmonella enterica subsp. enterica serovar Uppsala]|nr:hypothetical protein [Salmonella enterica subsp. enterica serovar Uppsala]
MARIAGIYANGFGAPVPGVQLVLTARTTSAGVIMTTNSAQATGADGSYNFDVLSGVYVVTASGAYLGVINVCPDSPDGTLNDYLTNFSADELTPAALAEIQELIAEAKKSAETAVAAAEGARAASIESGKYAESAKGDAAAAQQAVIDCNRVTVNNIPQDENGNIKTYGQYVYFSNYEHSFTPIVDGLDTEFVGMIANNTSVNSLTINLDNFNKASFIYRLRIHLSVQKKFAPNGVNLIIGNNNDLYYNNEGVRVHGGGVINFTNDLTVIDLWRIPSSDTPIVQIVYQTAT